MSQPTIHIFCPGVLTIPGSTRSWASRAVTHCIAYRKLFAEKVEYFSFPTFDRVLRHTARIKLLKSRLGHYQRNGFDIHLVGHSNGNNIIIDAIRQLPELNIKRLDLLNAACEGDFQKNGLNKRLMQGTLDSVHYYVGGKDWPLFLADTFTGWLLFGYGRRPLGRWGAYNVDDSVVPRVVRHDRDDLGHAGFFNWVEFERTMGMILGV